MNPLVDLTPTSQLQTEDDKNADFFESDVLFQMIGVIGWIILTASIIVLAWVSEPCITRITSRWKQVPRCVVETGNVNTIFRRLLASSNKKDGDGETQHDIVLPNAIRERFIDLELAAKQAIDAKSPLTPVFFHGPSGTGKRSTAKQLSQSLSLPYALVSGKALAAGSSFQIDALVSWANSFSGGNAILIFIDEADAFLSKDNSRSKYLSVLDGVRRDIFFILAARDVENIDQAVLDRCEQIQFSLPDAECRRELLLKYFDEHVSLINTNNEYASSQLFRLIRTIATKDKRMQSIDNGVMSGESLENTVALTRGLSGRDIRELMVALKKKLRRSKHGQVTYLDVWEAIEEAQMKQRSSSAGTVEHSISMTNLQNEVDFHEVTVV
mmetsp:Transcript_24215/g.37970  ORF Transcript_24215/g.37970 Transcript_24215/m.37970 type:complete len:384 (+) Transcript_24215:214-1365(+)|eukprot:CAMPEP_0201725812 /NCGR_PEP_ID=MMETSP0593-20130828/9094_1 /ASSEMBLY_ACC=CAM_ASM_000672 /TAXON_ID=267983 /ORGANISM="Skeletonema japonicum, Strain CCMP2506" /LENGTH=383 /DNA_ID=CAMNT_0048217255 /DNA_START=171 /DNA_END=1322 /DNA_ORIENTATION=+